MTDISSQIGVSTHSSKTNNEMWESRGRYTIHFCKTNNRGVGIGEDKVFWAIKGFQSIHICYPEIWSRE